MIVTTHGLQVLKVLGVDRKKQQALIVVRMVGGQQLLQCVSLGDLKADGSMVEILKAAEEGTSYLAVPNLQTPPKRKRRQR